MVEGLVVLALGAALLGSAWVVSILPWTTLFAAGLWMLVAGMVTGAPAGLCYHIVLARKLSARGDLPRLWWLRPVRLHERLLPGERPGVLLWFRAGAVGFVVALLGCMLVAVGALRS